jgi:hypothetical protein
MTSARDRLGRLAVFKLYAHTGITAEWLPKDLTERKFHGWSRAVGCVTLRSKAGVQHPGHPRELHQAELVAGTGAVRRRAGIGAAAVPAGLVVALLPRSVKPRSFHR